MPVARTLIKRDDPCMLNPTGTAALRRGRYSHAGQIYHVTTATHARKQIFTTPALAGAVISALHHESEAGRSRTLAFVVMPDHLHWLLQLKRGASLSSTVNNVKAHSAKTINRLLNRRGRVWQSGFHDHALRREENIVAVARYIVANPVRAGLIDCVDNYPFWGTAWGRIAQRDL